MSASRRIRLVGGVALLVASAGLALAGASQAQDAVGPGVDAFTLTARGHVVRVTFDTPGALPIGPLVELTAPEARAGLSTGDVGDAFSSVGFPGPVLSGLPQILATQGAALPLPPYPFVAEATTSGPTDVHDTTSLPGSTMTAVARDGRAEAEARTPALVLPSVIGIGSLRSAATAVHTTGVTTTASAELADVDLLGGLIHLGALRSHAEATSDGGRPTGSASTSVVDASLLGVPIRITPDGIELVPGQSIRHQLVASLLAPLGGPDGLLAATGLRIRAGATISTITDDSAQVGAEGLTVEVNGKLDVSALADVVNALPALPTIPGSPVQLTDAVGILGSDQIRSFSIGQVTAELTARPALGDGSSVDPGLGGAGGLPDLGSGSAPPAFDELGTPVGLPGGTPGRSGSGTGSDPLPLPPLPASGALAALGGGLLLSVGLRRFADVVLDPAAAPGAACALVTDLPDHPDGGPLHG